jgi:hypothetical protein
MKTEKEIKEELRIKKEGYELNLDNDGIANIYKIQIEVLKWVLND